MAQAVPPALNAFITRWSRAQAAERANYQLFLSELCDVLEVPRPDPAGPDTEANAYVFERAVPLHHSDGRTTTGRIDLYRRGCFVLEAKQYAAAPVEQPEFALETDAPRRAGIARGSEAWDRKMIEARSQAERYAHALPVSEEPPPFLLVVDVGHSFELFADFSQKGKAYLHFPDARTHRLRLDDLRKPEVRERLRAVWLDPHSLDPAKKAAAVTREIAGYLAELAKSLEKKKHPPELVAAFLSRCLFCMFAEDVGLLPKDGFKNLLDSVQADPGAAVPLIHGLFEEMNTGGYSLVLRQKLLHFNGGLFADATVLPIDGTQLGLLRRAAALEWRHVEPAIFGTLLERALDPAERHKLGAHYTPRAYVERLVLPTVIEPLRDEWENVRAAAITLATRGDLKAAIKETRAFHHRLCGIRVLDPACGSGNFLYVTLEHMKRLEGEVLELAESFGENMRLDLAGETVDPHQFLGLEINPRAATIAELVLWIGHLQWHHRNRGSTEWPEPVLRAFKNIECRDAVLAYDSKDFAKDDSGKLRYVWDRRTYKTDPTTGRDVPDEHAVRPLDTFKNPRPATWPAADFIVGNPPFLGTKRMREDLGDGYVETLRAIYSAEIEDNADFVMYWWHKAAEATLDGRARRFGFITTNSIRQAFNRRVVHRALLQGISLRFAIPDHPWVDTADGAAVRIAMTVGALSYQLPTPGRVEEPPPPDPSALAGDLWLVRGEEPIDDGSLKVAFTMLRGRIGSGLNIGAELEGMVALSAVDGVCGLGVALHGSGFILEPEQAKEFRKHGSKVIKPYMGGSDLLHQARERYLIDFSFMSEEEARCANPTAYNHVIAHVRPERIVNRREAIKRLWWRFGWERPEIRKAMEGLPRFIGTTETAKHRVFQFIDGKILPDHMVIVIASDDAFHLGVLSSRIHVVYSLAAGGRLGVGNDPRYNKTRCFDPFPFPDCTETQKERIRKLAEELDAHRKRAQQKHGLGLTDIYNVLGKLRAGTVLSTKERALHDAALVSTLKHLHDELDAAVADAYGWPWPLTDEEILERVVALNAARADEEAAGTIRWLRPEYQIPRFAKEKSAQTDLPLPGDAKAKPTKKSKSGKPAANVGSNPAAAARPRRKLAWPKTLAERAKAVESALAAEAAPVTPAELATRFARAKPDDVAEILDTLRALGRARSGDRRGTFLR
jgi:hypothetical protein